MRESVWLQAYEQKVNEKRNNSNKSKKIILLIIPMMLLIFMLPAMMNGAGADPQAKSSMIFTVAVFAAILLFAVLMIGKGKKMDVTKHTRENVKALLRTDEEVERFDYQMSMPPIAEVNIASQIKLFLTEDYLGKQYIGATGDLAYTFIRRQEIASLNYKKTASTTGNPLKAAYFFDICDADNNVMLNGLADSGKQLEQLQEMLKSDTER